MRYSKRLADEICEAIAIDIKDLDQLCTENKKWSQKDVIETWLRTNKDFQRKYKYALMCQKIVVYEHILDLTNDMPLDETMDLRIATIQKLIFKFWKE